MYILLHLHIIQNRKGNVILTGRNCLAMSQGKHHLNKVRLDRQFLSNLRESCNANQPQLRSGKVQCITECTGSTSNNEFVTNLGITGCLNSYHIWCESPLLLQKSKVMGVLGGDFCTGICLLRNWTDLWLHGWHYTVTPSHRQWVESTYTDYWLPRLMGPFSVFTVFVGVISCFWCGRQN